MFPEYRDLITRLKGHDAHFTRLFDKHNALDQPCENGKLHFDRVDCSGLVRGFDIQDRQFVIQEVLEVVWVFER